MKLKRKRRGRLIFTLCMLIVTILFSVGGLKIINGVSAGSDVSVETKKDEISVNELINSRYNSGTTDSSPKVPVKIENADECIDIINYFLTNKAYVVKSSGKMNASAKDVRGLLNIDNINVCDLVYTDWYAHET